ncbi:MAG: helix-turn-helix domain-containing protein, partial [Syntrophomonadaceae bacterium]|nr:helix-turn-helix domain-containing protein [Syntrophomonadaceae bacterium]
MSFYYEFVKSELNLPVKATIYEVHKNELHWHKHIEIVMVLAGSVSKRIDAKKYLLKAGDLAFVNSNEVHNTAITDESNLLLAMQINPKFFKVIYPNFMDSYFECNEVLINNPNEQVKDNIKRYLAHIVKELVQRNVGYRSNIASFLFLLMGELLAISPLVKREDKKLGSDEDLIRLERILNYIDSHINRAVTLKEIADNEHLSYYYASHFIKEKLGMTFQEYLNQTRLDKALYLLMYSEKTSQEISKELGFRNLAAFNKLFKEEYGLTPSKYLEAFFKGHTAPNPQQDNYIYKKREGINVFYDEKDNIPPAVRTYFDVDRTNALEILFSYVKDEEKPLKIASDSNKESLIIRADANKDGQEIKPYWRKLITATRAAEGLRENWQNQLQEMQKEIAFEQIRFHGILSDDMMVFQTSLTGEVSYNWTYVDNLLDKLLANNIKPFVELSFMPDDLKSNNQKAYWWGANVSPPNDLNKWLDLISAFVKHLINRYGLAEVESWYFEVWNEPELEYIYWTGTKEDYFEFYKATVSAIKKISPKIKVGGPSITHQAIKDGTWLEDFLHYCVLNQVPLDFVSLHIYPERYPEVEADSEIYAHLTSHETPYYKKMQMFASLSRIYYDADITYKSLLTARKKINSDLGYVPELCITEWNASASPRNLIHDTAFIAAYIIHNVVKCIGIVDMLGYWTFTDINEEIPLGVSHFHGNYGLINKDGIKKASYYAYFLLGKLGQDLLAKGDNYIITK